MFIYPSIFYICLVSTINIFLTLSPLLLYLAPFIILLNKYVNMFSLIHQTYLYYHLIIYLSIYLFIYLYL